MKTPEDVLRQYPLVGRVSQYGSVRTKVHHAMEEYANEFKIETRNKTIDEVYELSKNFFVNQHLERVKLELEKLKGSPIESKN